MKYYFAPMDGVTRYVYRNAHKTFFDPVDKYFTPFIVANQTGKFKSKERNEFLPENNLDSVVIPQILSNNAEEFIRTAYTLKEHGYDEVNLNLGCPSNTVVSKGKGSGFLAKREMLDAFLEEIFTKSVTKISVKTRIGKESPDEFYDLIEIYNKYPMEELIIHPRIQRDFYNNKPNMNVFKDALALSKHPICYNGDIFDIIDYKDFTKNFPSVDRIMIGRGLIANPGLIHKIKNNVDIEKQTLKAFHDMVRESYKEILTSEIHVLCKMKELWFYMIRIFTNSEYYGKKIRKSETLQQYNEIINSLFQEEELDKEKIIRF